MVMRRPKVSVVDLNSLSMTGKIQVGENPDAITYEPSQKEIFAFNGRGKSVSVIDAKSEKVVATVALPGKPEFAAVDPGAHRVYVNIEDKNLIVVLDSKTHKVVETWPLKDCESPTGIAIDLKNHRLFSVCENEKMVMTDSQTGHSVASAVIGQGADGAAFDAEKLWAFSSNGKSGTLSVIQESTPDKLTALSDVKTQVGARTMTLNPKCHRIFLPTADFQPAVKDARPKFKDGTQKVLVFEP
jgi:YVTN family beta-propeller protein